MNYCFLCICFAIINLLVNAEASDELQLSVQKVIESDKILKNFYKTKQECTQVQKVDLALECLNSLCPKDPSIASSKLNPYQIGAISKKQLQKAEEKFNKEKGSLESKFALYEITQKKFLEEVKKLQQKPDLSIGKENLVDVYKKQLKIDAESGFLAIHSDDNPEQWSEADNEAFRLFTDELKEKSKIQPSYLKDIKDKVFNKIARAKILQEKVSKLKSGNHSDLAQVLENVYKEGDAYEFMKTFIIVDELSSEKNGSIYDQYLKSKFKSMDTNQFKKVINSSDTIQQLSDAVKADFIYSEIQTCDPKALKDMVNDVKMKYSKYLPKKFSKTFSDKMNSYLNKKLKIQLESDTVYGKAHLISQINSFLDKRTDVYQKLLLEKNDKKIVNSSWSYYDNGLILPHKDRNKEEDEDKEEDKDGVQFSDYFDGAENIISISAYSCANLEIGKNVIAHEVGHALSRFISSANSKNPNERSLVGNFKIGKADYNKFIKLRKCIDGYHVATGEDMLGIHDGDTLRTEEDMADWLSMEVKGNGNAKKLLACNGLSADKEYSENYTDLEYVDEHLFESQVHSTAFFRAISEAYNKNILGPKCEEFIKEKSDVIRLKKCE